jgi:2-keto-3-deoxy-L-rhamnonate aldolase RhmA
MNLDDKLFTLKKRINAGETIVGASISIDTGSRRLEELLEGGTYEFILIDSQHSPYDEDRLTDFCKMAHELGVHVQFRIKHTRHTYLVGNYLDLGPGGIEVPQVESDDTVDEAVSNFYYSPWGVRSWGGKNRFGLGDAPDRLEYAKWWGETGVLWMQIESVAAVTKARQFAKSGVDCLSFGPADLSFSLELHPSHPFKSVDECIAHVVEQLQDTNVAVCFRNTPQDRQKYKDMGVRVLLESV